MNIYKDHITYFVMDVVEGKNKASYSDFFTELFRFSFPGEWQVCIVDK